MWRSNLISKVEVKQKYLAAREAESKNVKLTFSNQPSVNNDLESFCSNLRNPQMSIKRKEIVHSFLTQELTEEELFLVNNHDEDYAKTLSFFHNHSNQMSKDQALENLKNAGSPDSKFVKSFCQRQTFLLYNGSVLERIKQFKIAITVIIVLAIVIFIIAWVLAMSEPFQTPLIFFTWPNDPEDCSLTCWGSNCNYHC